MNDEYQRILSALVRVGKVSSVDASSLRARVYFDDLDMVSDWLPVLQRRGTYVVTSTIKEHSHDGYAYNWMPSVNDHVLCLYLPMFNADGFILGAIP